MPSSSAHTATPIMLYFPECIQPKRHFHSGYFMDASTPTCLKLASFFTFSPKSAFPLLHHSKWHHQPSDAQLEARATVVIFKAIHPPLSLGSRSAFLAALLFSWAIPYTEATVVFFKHTYDQPHFPASHTLFCFLWLCSRA